MKVLWIVTNINQVGSVEKVVALCNPKVIAVGRLVEVKGFDTLIKAFAKINTRYPQWTLEILGEGEERKKLEEIIRKNNLEDAVSLPGFTKDVRERILDSSIFVLSSNFEGFGMVVLEAMSCGLPIVSFELPSTTEILGNNRGLLIKEHNEDALADGLCKMMESRKVRLEYAEKSQKRILDYTIERIGDIWIQLFHELVRV